MALTPATVRLDLKCGRGAISEGEKCHVGPATKTSEVSTNKLRSLAKSKRRTKKSPTKKVLVTAGVAYMAASLYQLKNQRQAYETKFSPAQRYSAFKGQLGNLSEALSKFEPSGKTAGMSMFGDVSFGKLNGKDVVVKKIGDKGVIGGLAVDQMRMGGIISDKTADALKRGQSNLQVNEVQTAELAGKLGFGPKVIAAGDNNLITEVAKGRPLLRTNLALRYGEKQFMRDVAADPLKAVKKAYAIKWRGAATDSISPENKKRILETMGRMHTAGIAHNDLHPGNIFISKSGAQFIDYGTSDRGGVATASEFVRMMNKPRAGLQEAGGMGYNLRSIDPKGYADAETKLRKAIGKKIGSLTAADIQRAVKHSKDPHTLEKQLQNILDDYYTGYANRMNV